MQAKLIHEVDGLRIFALVLESGEEAMTSLQRFAGEQKLSAAQFSAIGAFSDAEIAYFDWTTKAYRPIPVTEQVEVATLSGDVALAPDGNPAVHAHVVLGRRNGAALAGHLVRGHVRPTLEIIITESPAHLRKECEPESGLILIRPQQ